MIEDPDNRGYERADVFSYNNHHASILCGIYKILDNIGGELSEPTCRVYYTLLSRGAKR